MAGFLAKEERESRKDGLIAIRVEKTPRRGKRHANHVGERRGKRGRSIHLADQPLQPVEHLEKVRNGAKRNETNYGELEDKKRVR